MSVHPSVGPASACEAAEDVIRTELPAVATDFNDEQGFIWIQPVSSRAVETVADDLHKPGSYPTIRLTPGEEVESKAGGGLATLNWQLTVMVIVEEQKRKDGEHDHLQRTAALRVKFLARAVDVVLQTRGTGLLGKQQVYQMKRTGGRFIRPHESPNVLGYETTYDVTQRVHSPC